MDEVRTMLEAADIAAILKALPQRYPFLMVDRIINMRDDESAIGIGFDSMPSPLATVSCISGVPENPYWMDEPARPSPCVTSITGTPASSNAWATALTCSFVNW